VSRTQGRRGESAAHGFSEILYAFTSAGNNNGSAFADCPPTRPSTTRRSASSCGSAVLADRGRTGGCRVARRQEARTVTAGTIAHLWTTFIILLIGTVLLVER